MYSMFMHIHIHEHVYAYEHTMEVFIRMGDNQVLSNNNVPLKLTVKLLFVSENSSKHKNVSENYLIGLVNTNILALQRFYHNYLSANTLKQFKIKVFLDC